MRNFKTISLTFVFAILLSGVQAQEPNYKAQSECPQFNAFVDNAETLGLSEFVHRVSSSGQIYLDPGKISEVDSIISKLGLQEGVTFQFKANHQSRLNPHRTTERYEQYYQGVKVKGGGYTVAYHDETGQFIGPGGDPCGPKFAERIAPQIFFDIDVATEAALAVGQIPTVLGEESVISTELVIYPNILYDCAYALTWEVLHENGAKRSWIDAENGAILKSVDAHVELNAPTVLYGQLVMPDFTSTNGTTFLSTPDGSIVMYDLADGCDLEDMTNTSGWDASMTPATTEAEWTTEASEEVYQNFWLTSQILPIFSTSLDIDFGPLSVSTCGTYPNAFAPSNSTVSVPFMSLGNYDGHTLGLPDIIAHELAHTYLFNFLQYTELGNQSLHEGLSDIFGAYIESKLSPPVSNGIDWVLGDDINEVASWLGRDMQNPSTTCVNSAPNLQHERGIPLSHWFFLVSQGSQQAGIPALGEDLMMDIILSALPELNSTADYPQMMEATLNIVREEYGRCSDEFLAIARAWEVICVPTNEVKKNGKVAACGLVIDSDGVVCEESNRLNVCAIQVNNPNDPDTYLDEEYFNWYIIGQKNTNYQTHRGMVGNRQEGGDCLNIFQFPQFNYYPQKVIIEIRYPGLGDEHLHRRYITINDCDGDDPTCEEFYGLSTPEGEGVVSTTNINEDLSPKQVSKKALFNSAGQKVLECDDIDECSKVNLNGIYFMVSFGSRGEVIRVEKLYFNN